jgi:hypothetical protein
MTADNDILWRDFHGRELTLAVQAVGQFGDLRGRVLGENTLPRMGRKVGNGYFDRLLVL